jgi:predicted dehydrogenase
MPCDRSGVLRVGIVGFGYWGPNLARNFAAGPRTRVVAIADENPTRQALAKSSYPGARIYADASWAIEDPEVDAVAIATPIFTHHPLAMRALAAGKHVLVEKPLAPSTREARELIDKAYSAGRVLMVDHTFVFTGAVRKIAELVTAGELGRVLYIDSVRINLGLFQPDFNVIWDLAPHDLTIIDYIMKGLAPTWVSAVGVSHYGPHENLAYLTLGYADGMIAHVHVNWMAPVKTRRTIIAGSKKMIVWDDTSPVEPVKVYDSSVDYQRIDKESAYALNVQYRSGDVYSPKLDGREALSVMAQTFAAACLEGKETPSGGQTGLRIVRILEAAQQSLVRNGERVALDAQEMS